MLELLLMNKEEQDAEIRKNAKARYPTYEAAIAEIVSLQQTVTRLITAYELMTYKKKRGRPKGARTSSPSIKKRLGRPAKHTKEEMRDRLEEWDEFRSKIAPEVGKKIVTDNDAVKYIFKKNGAGVRQRKLNEMSHDVLKKIGYFRDQTGIRIRKNQKPKTKK